MKRNTAWVIVTVLTFVCSCKKNRDVAPVDARPETGVNSEQPTESLGDGMSAEDAATWDTIPRIDKLDLSKVILPNGVIATEFLKDDTTLSKQERMEEIPLGNSSVYAKYDPQAAKNLLIQRMCKVARDLTDRSRHTFPDDQGNPTQPNGIAYAYDVKDYSIKKKGTGEVCPEIWHSLDCSGFIYQLFLQAGVRIGTGRAHQQREPEILEGKLRAVSGLDKLKATKTQNLHPSLLEAGDIIYWDGFPNPLNGHCGMVIYDKDGKLVIAASNGQQATKTEICSLNIGPDKGPTLMVINPNGTLFKGRKYTVTRMVSPMATLTIKCPSQSLQPISVPVKFSQDQSPLVEYGEIHDNDGRLVGEFKVSLSYNGASNALSCEIQCRQAGVIGPHRTDNFSVQLRRDDMQFEVEKTYDGMVPKECPFTGEIIWNYKP